MEKDFDLARKDYLEKELLGIIDEMCSSEVKSIQVHQVISSILQFQEVSDVVIEYILSKRFKFFSTYGDLRARLSKNFRYHLFRKSLLESLKGFCSFQEDKVIAWALLGDHDINKIRNKEDSKITINLVSLATIRSSVVYEYGELISIDLSAFIHSYSIRSFLVKTSGCSIVEDKGSKRKWRRFL